MFLKIKTLRSIKNDCGFTLIEAVIAIAIISFALGALVLMVTSGFGGVSGAAHKSHATHTAQNQIERGVAYLQGALENEESEFFVPADINLKDETIELRFQDVRTEESGEITIFSSGKVIDAKAEEKGQESSLLTFIPYTEQ
jgi:prepilin-type N-terminal cleavage/methylation domain-containing protein